MKANKEQSNKELETAFQEREQTSYREPFKNTNKTQLRTWKKNKIIIDD